MKDNDKPVGQRKADGQYFGTPPHTYITREHGWDGRPRVVARVVAPTWAGHKSSVTRKRWAGGWRDGVGMPHGRSGDKMSRKVACGKVGMQRVGMYDAWALKQVKR